MREEYVTLSNIEVSDLYDAIKTHLQQDLKLDIIHEDKFDNEDQQLSLCIYRCLIYQYQRTAQQRKNSKKSYDIQDSICGVL